MKKAESRAERKAASAFYTVKDVMVRLDLGRNKVLLMISLGSIKAQKMGPKPNSPYRIAKAPFDKAYPAA